MSNSHFPLFFAVEHEDLQDQEREYLTRQLLHSVALKRELNQDQEDQEREREVKEVLHKFNTATTPTAMPEVLAGTPTQSHNKATASMMSSVRMTTISPTLSMNGSSNEATNCKYKR